MRVFAIAIALVSVAPGLRSQESWSLTGPLRNIRSWHTATLLPDGRVLVTGGNDGVFSLDTFEFFDQRTGTWIMPSETLNEARRSHTATLLSDGRVLVAGGFGRYGHLFLNSFEIFDPETGTWTITAETLNETRGSHTATLLPDGRVLAAGGVSQDSFEIFDPETGIWTMPSETLNEVRRNHTATLLPDGQVLVAGGESLNSFEVFDPGTGTWTMPSETLNEVRVNHTATLLPDGRVLVAGGSGLNTFEIFDPQTGIWTMPSETLNEVRENHTATLLPDGRVLVAGGNTPGGGSLNTFEIFDPATGVWAMTAETLNKARGSHTATLLADGRVLAAGGAIDDSTSFEIFDPATSTWTMPSETTNEYREDHTATLLPDGRVLAAGGYGDPPSPNSFEIFDPGTGTWTMTAETLNESRRYHTATLLADGRVLVAGGNDSGVSYLPSLNTFEIFDPGTGIWTMTAETLNEAREDHTATLLPDGRVLVVGGLFWDENTAPRYSTSSEIFDPETGTWTMTAETLNESRSRHTATLLPDGRVLVAGGETSGNYLDSFEIFDPEIGTWTMTAETLNEVRVNHTATLLADGRVVAAGGFGFSRAYLNSFEIFDPGTGTWTMTGETLNEVRNHHTATLLPDGRVLAAGGGQPVGYGNSFEIFIPLAVEETRRPIVTSDPFVANWDPVLWAPTCPAVGSFCDTASLLRGRDSIANSEELNAPNTIDGSPDGTGGIFHVDGSVERLRIFTPDGSLLTETEAATVEATIRASDAGDSLKISSSPDADNPSWTLLTTLDLSVLSPLPGLHTLSHTFALPAGSLQAVRARLYRTSSSGTYDDNDDLVFAVAMAPAPYVNPIAQGTPFVVTGTGFGGDSEASGGAVQSSAVNFPITTLRSVEGERTFTLIPDSLPLPDLSGGAATLTFSSMPDDLDVGMYYLTVTASGVPSVARLVNFSCGALSTTSPADVTVDTGLTAHFSIAAEGGRAFQWQRCITENCLEGDWEDIIDATSPSYTTQQVVPADSGTKYRAEVRGACGLNPTSCDQLVTGCVVSDSATLTVADSSPPTAEILHPSGGEYWLISDSDTGDPPNTQLITWSMSDDIRICRVDVSLWSSDDGGLSYTCVNGCNPDGSGLPISFGPGGTCVHPGEATTSVEYTIPASPPSGTSGSLYKVQVEVTDHAGQTATVRSTNPFYIVQPNPDSVKTLILANLDRMETEMGATPTQTAALETKLYELADHPRVLGMVVDLGAITELQALYSAWDASPSDYDLANAVLFSTDGIHELLLELYEIYSGVEHVVLVGDDRIIPFARVPDGATLFPESNYPAGGDLTATGTTVGRALAADRFLSDDPLAVLDPVEADDLDDNLFIPDLNVGRLVESTEEITTTIATFISQDGVLDLTTLDPVTGHKVLITGYDFLIDSATVVRRRFKSALGCEWDASDPPWCSDDGATAPVDGALISSNWGIGTVAERRVALFDHLSGNSASPYAIASLNGHATHHGEGVPGDDQTEIEGLGAVHIFGDDGCAASIGPIDLAGAVLYSPGCHGGLPVPGACSTDSEHSLDLAQTMLARGAQAYVANTGYGWGLVRGIGYGERLVELFSEEMTAGGTVAVGEVLTRSKTRYVLETPRLDAYDAKSLMQWTLYGLPMYAVRTGISPDGPSLFDSPPLESTQIPAEKKIGAVTVHQALGDSGEASLPPYLMRLEMHFDLTASGVYTKRNASGDVITGVPGCPDPLPGEPEGCYYTLNGLVERGSGATDLPIQPYLVLDSRLSGTSQHGVLWLGGVYDEEHDWVPVISELISNGGDGSNHGSIARKAINRPTGTRILDGQDPDACRPSDLELNGLVVTTGEAVKLSSTDPIFDIERLYRGFDLEVLYYNNSTNPDENCDRDGPVFPEELDPDDTYQLSGNTLEWVVPVSDIGGIWRVVVVYTDNTVDGNDQGRWLPLDLADDGTDTDTWRGSMDISGIDTLTFVVQAVDKRGNVSWLEYQATQLPASGVELGIPMPVDVDDSQLFADGFESGNVARWSSSVP